MLTEVYKIGIFFGIIRILRKFAQKTADVCAFTHVRGFQFPRNISHAAKRRASWDSADSRLPAHFLLPSHSGARPRPFGARQRRLRRRPCYAPHNTGVRPRFIPRNHNIYRSRKY